jgi:hypothetical protein
MDSKFLTLITLIHSLAARAHVFVTGFLPAGNKPRTPAIPGHRGKHQPKHRIHVANGKWCMRAHRSRRHSRK